jgi:hypothetical protein
LYGNQSELQIDVSRFPRPEQYDVVMSAGMDPLLANVGSHLKTVSYYVRAANTTTTGSSQSSSMTSAGDVQPVLVRRVLNRAEAVFAAQLGDAGSFERGEQLLAEGVLAIDFLYFDGLDWYPDWDCSLRAGLPMAVSITVVVLPPGGSEPPDLQEQLAAMAGENVFRLTVQLPTAQPTFEDPTAASSTTSSGTGGL